MKKSFSVQLNIKLSILLCVDLQLFMHSLLLHKIKFMCFKMIVLVYLIKLSLFQAGLSLCLYHDADIQTSVKKIVL